MTETINGLLTQKANSPPPTVGAVKSFSWENRTGRSGNPYIKIKNETPEYGGKPYRIVSAQQTDFQDAHGNLSFNLEIESVQEPGAVSQQEYNSAPGRHMAQPARQDAPPRAETMQPMPGQIERSPGISEHAAQSRKVFEAGWKEAGEWIKTLPVKDLEDMSLECFYDLQMRAAQHIAIDTGKTIRKERF